MEVMVEGWRWRSDSVRLDPPFLGIGSAPIGYGLLASLAMVGFASHRLGLLGETP